MNATYRTDGFVVPVFSPNLHEIRGYNRLARLARGDFLIMMQVGRAGALAGWIGWRWLAGALAVAQ